jgi:hypothetical protein
MGRVADVLSRARSILADLQEDRYTETRLLQLYNDALLNIVTQTGVLKSKVFVEIEANVSTYILPEDVLSFERIQYQDERLPVKSHAEMDEFDSLWETRTGTDVEAVVANLTNATTLKIYPRITDATTDNITANSNYGIVIDVTYSCDIFNLPSVEDISTSVDKYLAVYYIKIPATVTIDTTDSELELSRAWDTAIAHYIAGMAYRDDKDSQDRAIGSEELQIYANDISKLKITESKAHTRSVARTSKYRGLE